MGARDSRTQSARACLFFFPSLQTHPQKNLKIWSLIPSSSFFQQILVLTLGSPPEKGGKKNPRVNPGQPAGKGREKKNARINPGQPAGKGRKKNPRVNPGQPIGKGREKKTLVLTLGSPPEKGGKKSLVLTLGSPPEKGGKKKPSY